MPEPYYPPVQPTDTRLLDLIREEAKKCAARIQDAGGRNPLLYRRGTRVDLDLFTPDVAEAITGGRSTPLLARLRDSEQAPALRTRLRGIAKRARDYSEERGLEVLHVALGLAKIPKLATETSDVEAPLALQPVRLVSDRAADDFRLEPQGEPVVNLSLIRFLARTRNIDIREAADRLVDMALQPLELLDAFASVLLDARLSPIVDRAYASLGLFTFAQEALVQDLEDEVDYLAAHPLIAALAGDRPSEDALLDVPDPMPKEELDRLTWLEEPLVLPADSSQRIEVATALRGDHRVIEGPPGTGKSQTIANLVAAFASRGKTVLFVAEKRAALEAVHRRLSDADLGHLIMDLHRTGDQKSYAYAQLSARWQQVDPFAARRSTNTPLDPDDESVDVRDELRERLNRRAQTMGSHSEAGATFGELLGQAGGVSPEALTDLDAWEPCLADVPVAAHQIGRALMDLYLAAGRAAMCGEHPFFGLKEGADIRQLRQSVLGLRDLLPKLRTGMSALGLSDSAEFLAAATRGLASLTPFRGIGFSNLPELQSGLTRFTQLQLPAPLRWFVLLNGPRRAFWRRLRANSPSISPRQLCRLSAEALAVMDAWEGTPALSGTSIERAAQSGVPADAEEVLRMRDQVAGEFDTKYPPALFSTFEEANTWLAQGEAELDSLPALARLSDALKLVRDTGVARAIGRSPDIENGQSASRHAFRLVAARALQVERAAARWPDSLEWSGSRLDDMRRDFQRLDAEVEAGVAAVVDQGSIGRAAAELRAAKTRKIRVPGVDRTKMTDTTPYDLLKREAGKQRAHPSLRNLIHWTDEAAISLFPCWAMSPLTVSQLMPRKQMFDVVIFDEASQVETALALPAIARGRQVIVAGDSKQLPPSPFFKRLTGDDDEEEWGDPSEAIEDGELPDLPDEARSDPSATVEEEMGADGNAEDPDVVTPPQPLAERPRGISVLLTSESILEAIRLKLPRIGSLTWHYRSRDERLIAFSNHYIYKPWMGGLTTFPAPAAISPIEFVHVPHVDGELRSRGASEHEVAAVANAAIELAARRPGESLGVVVFNLKLAERIDMELREWLREEAASGRADAAASKHIREEAGPERFFVKSIEQVQGDERDAIVLHLPSYYSASGKLTSRFGVINAAGGERRLNVAITRARRRMVVVSGTSPDELAMLNLRLGSGPDLLRKYVSYASRGGDLGQAISRPEFELNPFELEVMRALQRRGHTVEPQIGSIGYRIDLAIKHPQTAGVYALGIECDGASYHSASTARDRDRLRQAQLESIGWQICRIWSTDWFRDRDAQLARVEAALAGALEAGAGVYEL